MRAESGRPAAFLDRDGTLIRDTHYLHDPAQVVLLPGVPEALRRFADAGYALVVVTNQSGIARGMFTERDYEAVRDRLSALLATKGVRLDATEHCPHYPSASGPCGCRKPGTLMFERASAALGLAPERSVFIGDRWRDLEPGLVLGGRAILVPSPDTPTAERARAAAEAEVASDLGSAATLVLGHPKG